MGFEDTSALNSGQWTPRICFCCLVWTAYVGRHGSLKHGFNACPKPSGKRLMPSKAQEICWSWHMVCFGKPKERGLHNDETRGGHLPRGCFLVHSFQPSFFSQKPIAFFFLGIWWLLAKIQIPGFRMEMEGSPIFRDTNPKTRPHLSVPPGLRLSFSGDPQATQASQRPEPSPSSFWTAFTCVTGDLVF